MSRQLRACIIGRSTARGLLPYFNVRRAASAKRRLPSGMSQATNARAGTLASRLAYRTLRLGAQAIRLFLDLQTLLMLARAGGAEVLDMNVSLQLEKLSGSAADINVDDGSVYGPSPTGLASNGGADFRLIESSESAVRGVHLR